MPKKTAFREALALRLENFSTIILLPLFFALSGLRTQISLLNDWTSWILCGIIILVAITGKFVSSTAAARWSGSTWRESLAIGVLMNTRGLVELVALNIGYDLGIITPAIFTMMVGTRHDVDDGPLAGPPRAGCSHPLARSYHGRMRPHY